MIAIRQQTKFNPGPVRSPASGELLERKCACGGTPGPSGECEECRKKKRLTLQTKLMINEPGDIYEQEADRIADQVLATPADPAVTGAPPRIQRFSGQSNGQMDAAPTSVDDALASPGRPLEPEFISLQYNPNTLDAFAPNPKRQRGRRRSRSLATQRSDRLKPSSSTQNLINVRTRNL